MKEKITLTLILLFSAFFRLYQLGSLPISLFGDEIDVGYHAWSLVTTGRDYRGNFLPTYIQSLSEARAPLLMYLTTPFVGLLGPSTVSVRLPAAIFGVASVYLIYLLANLLFSHKKPITIGKLSFSVGLVAALLLAVTPWHLHYSRTAFELSPLFFFTLLGIYWYLRAREEPRFSSVFFIPFVLTFYTYSTANLFTPIILAALLWCFPPERKVILRRGTLIGAGISLLLLAPILYHLTLGAAAGRFRLINIFADPKIADQIVIDRTRPWVTNPTLERLFHNKATAYLAVFGTNYLRAFSTEFLFISGDPNFRQSVSRFGQLLAIAAPFFLIGLVTVGKGLREKPARFIFLWLLAVPLGASLTLGGGSHASRLFLLLFPLTVLTAIGFIDLMSTLKNQHLRTGLALAALLGLVVNLSAYWYRYNAHYRYESARVWQYGYAQIMERLAPLVDNANRVFINNTADPTLYRFAFYTKLPPGEFQKQLVDDVPRENLLPGFSGFKFADRFYFGRANSLESFQKLLLPGDLYVAVQGEEIPGDWDWSKTPPEGIKALATVRDFYDQPLMYLLEKTP